MHKVYLISGLGIDAKVFQYIDFEENSFEYLPWIEPGKDETIESYAKRFALSIKEESPILIGFSFGGMLAIEISKHIQVEKLILISSIKNKSELPSIFTFFAKIRLHQFLPLRLLKINTIFTNRMFGASSLKEKKLLSEWLKSMDYQLMVWSIDKILNWKNESIPSNLYHIQGEKDLIFPIRNIKNCIKIKEGRHLMTLNKSEEIKNAIKTIMAT